MVGGPSVFDGSLVFVRVDSPRMRIRSNKPARKKAGDWRPFDLERKDRQIIHSNAIEK
jgi:hypothetical protein